jgi:hypothetical protein
LLEAVQRRGVGVVTNLKIKSQRGWQILGWSMVTLEEIRRRGDLVKMY